MRVALFFGSFNPIHTGHLIIAQQVLNYTEMQQIWFVVSPQNPLKNEKSLLPSHQRLQLIQLAIEDEPKFKASNVEFKLPKPSYTVHTLAYLKEKYPQHTFSIIMGADSYSNLPKWKNYEIILNDYPLIVYPRNSYSIDLSKAKNAIVLETPLLNISATLIRKMVLEKKSLQYLVHDKVKIEIENRGYFKQL